MHARARDPQGWREYRAAVEAGGRKKVGASEAALKGRDQFDWGARPTRRPLLEIEQSQDAAARRGARDGQRDAHDEFAPNTSIAGQFDEAKVRAVVEAFTKLPLTEHERRVVQTLLDPPGRSSEGLTGEAGWRGKAWQLHFGKLCVARGHLLWSAPYEKKRDANFYSGIPADFDDATRGFTMKPEAVEGFRRLGLTAKGAA